MPTLARINVTPMKGTALQHPTAVELTSVGIPGSRRFFLTRADGVLYSGSDHGPLVQVRASVDNPGRLRCTFPDGTTVTSDTDRLGPATTVDFYGRPVVAREVHGPLAAAFSAFVGREVRVMRADRDGDGVDVHPLTVVSTASVAELGRRGSYEGDLDAGRFRINLELDGCEPFEEDSWDGRRVAIGEAIVRIRGQIPRCVVTTQDPGTGLQDWNTLKQIASFRALMPDRQVPFGMYAEVVHEGTTALGDPVAPLNN